jgi:hypothetical protein
MSMGLRDWVQYGWLTEHKSSREEIENLLGKLSPPSHQGTKKS